ncbi:MAG: pentapeptide repeat-containing protein, partial [Deltaproteobacteria bacterium]|nr:pentapeptide repeat-containing protein [Deltaproteobacteria bacterium]
KLKNATFAKGNFRQAVFEKAELSQTDFTGATLEECYLGHVVAPGARFNGAELKHADFSHADLTAADFTDANLFRTKFHLANRADAVLPRGPWLGDDEELARVEQWQPQHGAERTTDEE